MVKSGKCRFDDKCRYSHDQNLVNRARQKAAAADRKEAGTATVGAVVPPGQAPLVAALIGALSGKGGKKGLPAQAADGGGSKTKGKGKNRRQRKYDYEYEYE